MNNLYFVTAYKHRANEWRRYLLTAKDERGARDELAVEFGRSSDWKIGRVQFICTTQDEVYEEV